MKKGKLLLVEHALEELSTNNVDQLMAALEVLARLAWSDDEVSHLHCAEVNKFASSSHKLHQYMSCSKV